MMYKALAAALLLVLPIGFYKPTPTYAMAVKPSVCSLPTGSNVKVTNDYNITVPNARGGVTRVALKNKEVRFNGCYEPITKRGVRARVAFTHENRSFVTSVDAVDLRQVP